MNINAEYFSDMKSTDDTLSCVGIIRVMIEEIIALREKYVNIGPHVNLNK